MTRLEQLRKRLRSRDGKSGFTENCKAIRAEIARLEALEAKEPAE